MIELYRFEHPSGKFLYVGNSDFIKKSKMGYHNSDDVHLGVTEAIMEQYISRQYKNSGIVGSLYCIDDIEDEHAEILEYLNEKTFYSFFNSLGAVKEWFNDTELKCIFDAGYILYRYKFVVDFEPLKIYICKSQSFIDIEYMKRSTTIKEPVQFNESSEYSEIEEYAKEDCITNDIICKYASFIKTWEYSVGECFLDYFFEDTVFINSWAFWLIGKGYINRGNFLIESIVNEHINELDGYSKFHPNLTRLVLWNKENEIHAIEKLEFHQDGYNDLYNLDVELWVEFLLSTKVYESIFFEWVNEQANLINVSL